MTTLTPPRQPPVLQHLGITAERIKAIAAACPAPPVPRRKQSVTERNRVALAQKKLTPPLLPTCRDLFAAHPGKSNGEITELIRAAHPDYQTCCPKWLRYMVKNSRSQVKRAAAKRAAKEIVAGG